MYLLLAYGWLGVCVLGRGDFEPLLYEDDVDSGLTPRLRRDTEGSGGVIEDYGTEDDDEDQEYYSSTEIVPSRLPGPIPATPTFSYSLPPNTLSIVASSINLQSYPPAGKDRPARPPRLSSYYPGVSQEEGSGGGSLTISSAAPHQHGSEAIVPTRSSQYLPTSSSVLVYEEDVEVVGPTNHKPFIANRLDKLPLVAGKSSRVIIPANTFQDLEDGDTRDLSLRLTQAGTGADLETLGWIRFDGRNQELVALPLEANIGAWRFRVAATDKGGESVEDVLELRVRQHSSTRVFHHAFHLTVAPVHVWKFRHPMEWKLALLERIYGYYGDRDPGKMTVLNIREEGEGGGYRFSWTNETLPLQYCPREEVNTLFGRLASGRNKPTPGLKALLKEEFYIKDVELEWTGKCAEKGGGEGVAAPGGGGGPPLLTTGFDNSMPQIRNPVDRINVMAGELLQYQVPEDMCFDSENGETRYLDLSLLTPQRLEVATTNWLQFDKKNQEFYGVPLEADVGREAYQLVCADSQGLMAIDGIEVHVVSRPFDERFNMEFVFVFNDTLDDGNRLLISRVRLAKTIARIFNDKDTSNIVLKNVDPVTMEVTWYNKTISHRDCPKKYLQKTKTFLLDKDGRPRQHVVLSFGPEFHLADIKMIPIGLCISLAGPEPTEEPEFPLLIPHQEYILTFLVPALIIIAMLLFAILIACLLHRKRKAGKMEMFKAENLPPRIPVIMQDELSEDNFNSSKQPIILREEHTGMGGMSYQPGAFGQPPNYYGSGRLEEEFSECESLVNGNNGGLPPNMTQYARPPPVSLEFSDSLSRSSRHRPAPAYHRKQHFNP